MGQADLRRVLLAPVVDGLEYHPLDVTEASEHVASLLCDTTQYPPIVAVSCSNTHRLFRPKAIAWCKLDGTV